MSQIIRLEDIKPRYPKAGNLAMGKRKTGGGVERLDTWRLTCSSESILNTAAGIMGGMVGAIPDGKPNSHEAILETDKLIVFLLGEAKLNGYRKWNTKSQLYEYTCDGGTCWHTTRDGAGNRVQTEKPCVCAAQNLKRPNKCEFSTQLDVLVLGTNTAFSFELDVSGNNARDEIPPMVAMLRAMYGNMCAATLRLVTRRGNSESGQPVVYMVPELDECDVDYMKLLISRGARPPGSAWESRFQAISGARQVIEGDTRTELPSGAPQLPEAATVEVTAESGGSATVEVATVAGGAVTVDAGTGEVVVQPVEVVVQPVEESVKSNQPKEITDKAKELVEAHKLAANKELLERFKTGCTQLGYNWTEVIVSACADGKTALHEIIVWADERKKAEDYAKEVFSDKEAEVTI